MKKRILTWLQATSDQLHIGNYFGAIKPLLELSEQNPESEIFLFLAIMHSFNKVQDPIKLRSNAINILKLYIACWANPEKFFIYNPADIPWHAQLNWVLTCITNIGYMERMHTYKDALEKWIANELNMWVFCYPILMAADILLYDAAFVPVWKDQKQHLEFARDIAQKFNKQFGETFVVPQPYIQDHVATIPGIDWRKMSKSYNNYIWLLEDEKTLLKKVKQISTDTKTVEEPKDPDTCNVYNMLKLFLNEQEDKDLRAKYQAGGMSYKFVKDMLYEVLLKFLGWIQEKYNQISDADIVALLDKNTKIVWSISEKKIKEVYEKVGFRL